MNDAVIRRHGFRLLIAGTGAAYLAVALWGGADAVITATLRIGGFGVAVGASLSLLNMLLRFVRWQMFLHSWQAGVPVWPSLKIYLSGFALATTPGGVGEPVVRGTLLAHYGLSYQKSFAAYVAERLSDILAMAMIASVGLAGYPGARLYVLLVGATVLAFVGLLLHRQALPILSRLVDLSPMRKLRFLRHGIEVLSLCRDCFAPNLLVYGLLFGIVAWMANATSCYFLLSLVGTDVSLSGAMFVYAFSSLLGALSFLPGGIGGTEVAMIALLVAHGTPESGAIAVTIVHRSVTLWLAVALGVAAYSTESAGLAARSKSQ